MPHLTARAQARVLAGLYAALAAANSVSAAKRYRAGELATKPLLMPVLAAFALAAAGGRGKEMRLPAAGMVLSGLGDTALLGPESWFVPGMGAFAAAHACYVTALARDGAARGVRPRVAAGYAALWAVLIAVLWRNLGSLRVPVAAYSLLLVAMAVLASGRNREAAAGGALFVASDALIACGLAGISAATGYGSTRLDARSQSACKTKNRKHRKAEGMPARSSGNSSRAPSAGGGSLMTAIRKPAAVNASVIACSGLLQKLIRAVCPPMVHSSVRLEVAK
jgi:uncharacterized membrane protein YhhN